MVDGEISFWQKNMLMYQVPTNLKNYDIIEYCPTERWYEYLNMSLTNDVTMTVSYDLQTDR